MRRAGLLIGGFAVALGAAFAVGRAVQVVDPPEPPVVCPELPLAERLRGHIAGLAHIHTTAGAQLSGAVAGPRPFGPEPLAQLTILQGESMYRTRHFERTPLSETQPYRRGFNLRVSVISLQTAETTMFVTSACLPDHPVHFRVWREPVVRSAPGTRVLGELATSLPGCARPAVLGEERGYEDWIRALVCLDSRGATERTLLGPIHGQGFQGVGIVDVDGDGVDELIVESREKTNSGGRTVRQVLVHHDPVSAAFVVIELGDGG